MSYFLIILFLELISTHNYILPLHSLMFSLTQTRIHFPVHIYFTLCCITKFKSFPFKSEVSQWKKTRELMNREYSFSVQMYVTISIWTAWIHKTEELCSFSYFTSLRNDLSDEILLSVKLILSPTSHSGCWRLDAPSACVASTWRRGVGLRVPRPTEHKQDGDSIAESPLAQIETNNVVAYR